MQDNGQKKDAEGLSLMLAGQPNAAKYIGTLVAGVVIGVLVAWGWSAARGDSVAVTKPVTTAGSKDTVATAEATSTSLTLASQAAGSSVNVSGIKVQKPTWVVVYETKGDEPGNALGAKLFFGSSAAQSGTIHLLRSTTAGKTYMVGESVDNGNRTFDLHIDQQVVDEDGETVWLTFEAK